MSSDGVSEVSAGAGERVGGVVNGTNLALGSIAGSGACGGGRSLGAETHVNNELAEVGGFGKDIQGRWIGGEDMETFPEDMFETVKARIVGGRERQVMGVSGAVGVVETTE